MPEPTMQELLNQLQARQIRSANQNVLIQALRDYDEQTKAFRQLRGRSKLPLVTARDKTRLMELHKAVGVAADSVLGNEGEPQELREIVRKITALSSANYNALVQYDPAKEPKTLASLEEDVRTLTIHQGNVVLGGADSLSGAQSERVPLSFLDDKGNRISGVFSKKKVVEPEKQFEDAINKLWEAQLFGLGKEGEAMGWLKEHFYEFAAQDPNLAAGLDEKAPKADYLVNLLDACEKVDDDGKHRIDPGKLRECLEPILKQGNINAKHVDPITWARLAENLEPMIGPTLFAHGTGQIPYGGRIDNRNAAMSAVADLLGMPNVVARSKPMRIIDKDGNVIEGTFMEAAKGIDSENLPPSAASINENALKNTNGNGFRDIANLQVLDFLCGNYDRHGGNIFYQFDKNGKLCGVQGIDNDGAFGVIGEKQIVRKEGKVGKTDTNYMYMTNLENMKAIPEETAKRIEALDESTLKYALRGYGLSEAELKAAGFRLNCMKKAIQASREMTRTKRKPKLRIMSSSDFKKASIKDLRRDPTEEQKALYGQYAQLKYGNTFSTVADTVSQLAEDLKKQTKAYKDLRNATAVGMDNRAERAIAGKERVKGSALETILNKRTWWGFSSGNYEEMQRAVKNYVSLYKSIETRLNEANKESNKRMANYHHEKEAVVSEADLERMRSASEQMRDAAWNYLTGKMPGLIEWELDGQQPIPYPAGASDYTKRRIDAAADVYRMAKQGDTIKEVETQTARDNEREAEAAQRRREKERSPEAPQDHIVAI